MSCNGCRVLRKGCSDTCILRSCLQWIESPEAQGHATVFVAKFFGRAGMMSFISAVSESQRAALFQSLLYEACGRTVNPVFGAVGLLWSGNWAMCQAAVETVLKGGCIKPMSSCLSLSASAKPVQPHSSSRSGVRLPSSTNLTKRSRGMMETNSNIDPDSKRLGSLDQGEDPMPLMGQPEEQSVTVMNKLVVYASKQQDTRQEERLEPPPGQLVAPVPRRIRPQMGCYDLAAMVMRETQQQAQQQQLQEEEEEEEEEEEKQQQAQACEERQRQSHETVELDLTLNSHACKLGSPTTRVMRASSPSSFSINSEGSVISSDTAEFSACGVMAVSPPTEERHFLHLL